MTGDGTRSTRPTAAGRCNDLVQKPIEERLLVTKLLFQLRLGRSLREHKVP